MYCTLMLTLASFKMFTRNRAALFFSLFVPLMIMLIFGAMDFDHPSPLVFGLVNGKPNLATTMFLKGLRQVPNLTIHEGSLENELKELHAGKRTAVLDVPDDLLLPSGGKTSQLTAYLNQGRPLDANMARNVIHQMAAQSTLQATATPLVFTINEQSVSTRSVRYIEFLLPGIIAMAVMQMAVFSVAFVFAQYREKGVLKRVLATPVRPTQFVTANIITRLFMSLAQSALFIFLGLLIFHIHMQGSYWLLALCVLLGSLMFLGLGFTISGLARTMETVPLLANLIVFPMLFLGNIFFPASAMPQWLTPIAGNLPLTYFANALRAVMTQGSSFSEIRWNLLAILAWSVSLITLAMFTFRLQEREA